MRIFGVIIVMYVVFWGTHFYGFVPGNYGTWRDVEFTAALALTFGMRVAVPVIAFLVYADLIAGSVRSPWSALIYIVLVALGCGLYAVAMRYWNGEPFPTTSAGWYVYWHGYIPLLTTAAVPPLWRILRRNSRPR